MTHLMNARLTLLLLIGTASAVHAEWIRHTIDNSSRGADGVRVADVNGDQLPDLVTGWEEGGVIRVYTNPGPRKVTDFWPAVTVGKVKGPEDAVFADLDGDGHVDVISSCEGKTRSVFVHWASADQAKWSTNPFPALERKAQWMFAAPMSIDHKNGIDLVIAAKGKSAEIGWLQSPSQPRNVADWTWHPLAKVGWVMSIETLDMDGDGDLDLLYSDRKGSARGIHWLEYDPSADLTQPWKRHTIGGTDREVMFLSVGDLNQDGKQDIAATVKGGPITWFERKDKTARTWGMHEVNFPAEAGGGKGVAIADVDLDGRNDLVFTCESADKKIGAGWLSAPQNVKDANWTLHDISSTKEGIKFDLIQMIDLDQDGDLDLITCEERDNLGVIWYENPTR